MNKYVTTAWPHYTITVSLGGFTTSKKYPIFATIFYILNRVQDVFPRVSSLI